MTVPVSYRLSEWARPAIAGRAYPFLSLVFEGDSLMCEPDDRLLLGVANSWRLPWGGWHANNSSQIVTNSFASASAQSTYTAREYNWYGSGSDKTVNPAGVNQRAWTGNDSDGTGIHMAKLERAVGGARFADGDWTGEALTATLAWWATPTSVTARLRALRNGSTSYDQSVDFSQGTAGYRTQDLSIAAGAGDAWLDILTAAGVNETGKELIPVSTVFRRTGLASGVVPVWASHSGFNFTNHIDQTKCSDAQREAFYSAVSGGRGPDLFFVQLGTNVETRSPGESGDITALWYAAARDYLANRRASCARLGTSPRFLLASPHPTSGRSPAVLEDINEAFYQIAQEDAGVSFLNGCRLAGTTAVMGASFLADGTHYNTAGAHYMAAAYWGAIESASRSAPRLIRAVRGLR